VKIIALGDGGGLCSSQMPEPTATIEVREQISRSEARFDLWRRRIGLAAAPLLALITFLAAPDLQPEQRRLSAVIVLVIGFWITEAIPIPAASLLGASLCVLFGIGSAQEVFRPFADPVIFVFVGSFLIAQAMTANGLDRRVALGILGARWINGSPARIRLAVGATAALLSMWMSNTATVAILLPMVIGIADALDRLWVHTPDPQRTGGRYACSLMLMTAYAASIGGMATPVGTPPNLIGLGLVDDLAGRRIPFFEWMLVGTPVAVALFLVLVFLLQILHPAPKARLEGFESALRQLRSGIPAWGPAQTYTLAAFAAAVSLWMLPGAVAIVQGAGSPLYRLLSIRLNEGVVALLAASILFLAPVEWRPPRGALSWRQAVAIDWGTVLLFGGGLSLAGLMVSTGLARHVAEKLLGNGGAADAWLIMALAAAFSVLLSETASNTASATIIVPIAIAVAKAAGASPIPAALGATIGSSLGFMLPVSTPPNAIVYGSGRIALLQMLRAGMLLDFIGLVVMLLLLRLLCPLLGLM
jgi:sodium-dependent dicarboxylate transporter 2/3/5